MDNIKAKELIDKYLNGTCTPQEKHLLEKFYQTESNKRELNRPDLDFNNKKAEIWNAIAKNTQEQPRLTVRILKPVAAAAILLVLGFSLWFYLIKNSDQTIQNSTIAHNEIILPTNKQAVLTLSDGKKIVLDDAPNGTISNQYGKDIVKTGRGNIVYKNGSAPVSNKLVYNTMSTPKGGFFQLTLSDGSKVWLNSESSITFPVAFTGNNRSVTTTGEVYFEVAKNKEKPFYVTSQNQTIKVLGTHFNVLAYPEDGNVTTTLLEGSVKITKAGAETLLKPGQVAFNRNDSNPFRVSEVNTQDAIAWKEGYFKFDNESLLSISKKLSRWYNIDFEFADNIESKKFWGTYLRSKSLNDLLNDFEKTDDVRFKIAGRRVIIKKNN